MPSMKQTVIDYLIQTTFQSHVAGAFDPLESNKDNLSPIPQLGKAFDHVIGKVSSKKESVSDIIHRALLVNSSTNRTILSKPRNIGYSARQQQRVLQFLNMAVLSSNLLLYLSNLVPEVGSELMKVLSNKILNRPSEEELYLPAPMISARYYISSSKCATDL